MATELEFINLILVLGFHLQRAGGPGDAEQAVALLAQVFGEAEVYDRQFGRFFGRGLVRPGLPLDDE